MTRGKKLSQELKTYKTNKGTQEELNRGMTPGGQGVTLQKRADPPGQPTQQIAAQEGPPTGQN
jgi:hypothetical protein